VIVNFVDAAVKSVRCDCNAVPSDAWVFIVLEPTQAKCMTKTLALEPQNAVNMN